MNNINFLNKLYKYVELGKLTKSELGDLVSFNYTDSVTFARAWDELTLSSRGTIYNKNTGEVVAKSFDKFFNLYEMNITPESLPKTSFVAMEKVDGSLGIVFLYEEKIRVATRGSFYSEQAVEATKMANESPYKEAFEEMLQHGTPLVEIIYKSNRIVIDYGDQRKLVVLAIRKNNGTYCPPTQSESIAHEFGIEHALIIQKPSLDELIRQP